MRNTVRLLGWGACLGTFLLVASTAFGAGNFKPVIAGGILDRGDGGVKITSATNSDEFDFTWYVFGFDHPPGKGISAVGFVINTDPTETKNVRVEPAPGWQFLQPTTASFITAIREHVSESSGTASFARVHFGVTGTSVGSNSETTDFIMDPILVHFASVSQGPFGQSTTVDTAINVSGVGVDHHPPTPAEEKSWGSIKGLFKK